jgi:hypothetical protein
MSAWTFDFRDRLRWVRDTLRIDPFGAGGFQRGCFRYRLYIPTHSARDRRLLETIVSLCIEWLAALEYLGPSCSCRDLET